MAMHRAPEQDTRYASSVHDEAVDEQRFRSCVACGGRTTHTNVQAAAGPYTEYDNVLTLDLHGGYGQFFDGASHTVVLCHDCAHSLCEQLPWLNRILAPYRSHSHTELYHEHRPDHFGWDYLERKQDDLIHSFFAGELCPTCSHSTQEHAYGDPSVGFPCYICEEVCPLPTTSPTTPEEQDHGL